MDRNRTTMITAALGVAAAAAVAVGVGWGLAGASADRPGGPAAAPVADSTPTSPAPTPGAGTLGGADDPDPPSGGRDSGGQPGSGSSGGQPGQTGDGRPGSDGGPDAGPVIEVFRVVQEPLCPGGTTANPIPGQPVALEWEVAGTSQVTISIDGPGVYSTYPAEAGDSFSFGCAGAPGDIQEHTYLLTAVADGVTVTETLVVTARVNEVAEV